LGKKPKKKKPNQKPSEMLLAVAAVITAISVLIDAIAGLLKALVG